MVTEKVTVFNFFSDHYAMSGAVAGLKSFYEWVSHRRIATCEAIANSLKDFSAASARDERSHRQALKRLFSISFFTGTGKSKE